MPITDRTAPTLGGAPERSPRAAPVRRRRHADPIAIVERAYSLDGGDEDWLGEIGTVVGASFDRGLGVASYIADMGALPRVLTVRTLGTAMPKEAIIANVEASPDPSGVVRAHLSGELSTASQVIRDFAHAAEARQKLEQTLVDPWGIRDVLAFLASDGSGRVAAFCVNLPDISRPSRRERLFWARVASHVSAGLRLRARLAGLAQEPGALDAAPAIEAVLRPDGRLEDAALAAQARSAREALRQAVRAADRARGRLRRSDPEGAVELWRGLVAGRWSLVDRFESDGRRFVVACSNPLSLANPSALTERERPVARLAALGRTNRRIGYELGLSETTVATHLASALRKLRFRSRAALCSSWAEIMADGVRRTQVLGEPFRVDALSNPARRPAWLSDLTDSERAVALGVLEGSPNAEIAGRRGTSVHTVVNQLASIYRKLGVKNRTELAALGGRRRSR